MRHKSEKSEVRSAGSKLEGSDAHMPPLFPSKLMAVGVNESTSGAAVKTEGLSAFSPLHRSLPIISSSHDKTEIRFNIPHAKVPPDADEPKSQKEENSYLPFLHLNHHHLHSHQQKDSNKNLNEVNFMESNKRIIISQQEIKKVSDDENQNDCKKEKETKKRKGAEDFETTKSIPDEESRSQDRKESGQENKRDNQVVDHQNDGAKGSPEENEEEKKNQIMIIMNEKKKEHQNDVKKDEVEVVTSSNISAPVTPTVLKVMGGEEKSEEKKKMIQDPKGEEKIGVFVASSDPLPSFNDHEPRRGEDIMTGSMSSIQKKDLEASTERQEDQPASDIETEGTGAPAQPSSSPSSSSSVSTKFLGSTSLSSSTLESKISSRPAPLPLVTSSVHNSDPTTVDLSCPTGNDEAILKPDLKPEPPLDTEREEKETGRVDPPVNNSKNNAHQTSTSSSSSSTLKQLKDFKFKFLTKNGPNKRCLITTPAANTATASSPDASSPLASSSSLCSSASCQSSASGPPAKKPKSEPKETRTIEVQCDGPDWTPVVLRTQVKNRLLKDLSLKQPAPQTSGEGINTSGDSSIKKDKKIVSESSTGDSCLKGETHNQTNKRKTSFSLTSNKRKGEEDASPSTPLSSSSAILSTSVSKPSEESLEKSKKKKKITATNIGMKHRREDEKSSLFSSSSSSCSVGSSSLKTTHENPAATAVDSLLQSSSSKPSSSCSFSSDPSPPVIHVDSSDSCREDVKKKVVADENKKREGKKRAVASHSPVVTSTGGKSCEKRRQEAAEHQQQQQPPAKISRENTRKSQEEVKVDAAKKSGCSNSSSAVPSKKSSASSRRRRFRSGLDMIRHNRKRKTKTPSKQNKADSRENGNKTSDGQQNPPPPESVVRKLGVNKALGETVLHRAARQGYLDVVTSCLKAKTCDVNVRDNAAYTPLHECCSRGHLKIARALLQYGADPNASAAGVRVLHVAVESDNVQIVRLLLSYGADPLIHTYSGLTPLQLSRSKSMRELMRGFLSDLTGASPDSRPVLPWKFISTPGLRRTASSSSSPVVEEGFDVLSDVPRFAPRIPPPEISIESSEIPFLPTFRMPKLKIESSSPPPHLFVLHSDVLRHLKIGKEEFRKRFAQIQVLSVSRMEYQKSATSNQMLMREVPKVDGGEGPSTSSSSASCDEVDVVQMDDSLRQILDIEILRMK